ncbi:cytochrome P450 315a1, mitochondrial-like isoform X1 [Vespa mandarinia]|uniref:cytochrome P450 315a1, mitochondrial-like isoform X1 n=1 Tax=Vespa mandarinia TaxID=7446 RepID=UPI0016128945|nr:cytochrome P450 315a1, mitochondrial-like isoform X1 [Vespa mandarinia]
MRTLWSSLERSRPSLFNTVSISRKKIVINCNVHEKYEENKKEMKISSPGESYERKYVTSATTTTNITLREPPKPKGFPVFGTIFEFLTTGGAKTLHEYVDRRHKELGPIYRERIGPIMAIFVNSPQEYRRIFRLEGPMPKHFLPEPWVLYNELRSLQRGLLFMNGEEWLQFRRILNKVMLLSDPTDMFVGPCQKAAEGLVEKWTSQISNDNILSQLETQLYQWSIEAMLATLMGSTWHRHKANISRDSENLARTLHKIFEYTAELSILPAKLAKTLRLPSWNRFVESADSALSIVRTLVPEMVRLGGDGLLQTMMDEGIRDDDLVRIVTDFIIAAGDTTAFSTQWMLFLLGSDPKLQEKLYESIKNLSSKEILRDSLIKGVIKETLRLYPIAPFITRYLPEDNVIGGYFVPKGELLLLSLYSSSRDATNFPRPNEFYPERWIRTENGNYQDVVHPHANIPFALGARSCVGRKLAEIQISLVLAELVRTFKIKCMNKDEVKLILHLISVPSKPIKLKLIQRNFTER